MKFKNMSKTVKINYKFKCMIKISDILKPNIPKILVFLSLGIALLYFVKEDICGVFLFFGFCYKAYGFPLLYILSGNIEVAAGQAKTVFLGKYFIKSGNLLFNPAALILDLALTYLFSCLAVVFFNYLKKSLRNLKKSLFWKK